MRAASTWLSSGPIVVGGVAGQGDLLVEDGSRLEAPEVIVNPLGTLNGNNGTIVATVINNGGVVTPGDAHRFTTVQGDYVQNGGKLVFELGGAKPGESPEGGVPTHVGRVVRAVRTTAPTYQVNESSRRTVCRR